MHHVPLQVLVLPLFASSHAAAPAIPANPSAVAL
jgi:hypothetical protein